MRRCHIVWLKLLAILGRFLAVLPTMTCTRVFIIVGCLTLASSGGPVAAAAPAGQSLATPVPRESLEPFLNRYCIDCHNADEANGQVRFDTMSWQIETNDTAQRWQDVLDQLNGGAMPPDDASQPDDRELRQALASLTSTLQQARRRLTDHGGRFTLRRLNRREYSATIRHLFGFDVPLDEIPEDGSISSFDTVGAEQFFSSVHFEKYLALGRKVADEAFTWTVRPRQPTKVQGRRTEPEDRVTKQLRENLADLDQKMAMKQAGKTWQEMGFKDEGEAEIIFRQFATRAGHPRKYLEYPRVDDGVYVGVLNETKWVSANLHTDIRGDYIVRIHAGVHGSPDPIRTIALVRDHHGPKGTVQIQGTVDQPETVELWTRQSLGRFALNVKVEESRPDIPNYLRHLQGPKQAMDPWVSIWIDWLEIEGPFYPEWRPVLETILSPAESIQGGHIALLHDDARAGELIERFAFEAFRRRQPAPAFIASLTRRFEENRKAGMKHKAALADVLAIILASPGFLFLDEQPATPESSRRQLDSRELAIRLSYFLWSRPPDEELYAADLTQPAVLTAQVDRLLDDPRSQSFRDGFICQWAEFDRFDAITVDPKQYIRFNDGLRLAAKREVCEFFGVMLKEDLPAANLIDSDFVMVNPALAIHYGLTLSDCHTDAFQRVDLPADSPRGGLITQAAFLTTGSNGERTSPVIRGALILEKLLHDKPAPPPPNVPELSAAATKPTSTRDLVKLHQQQPVCGSCHRKIDAIGFGLEHFDAIGRWRETERVGGKDLPIETTVVLPSGARYATVQELKALLGSQQHRLARELLESLLTYALGRTVEFSDADDVEAMLDQLEPDNFPVRSMVHAIVSSQLFQTR
jgi:cytochrome c553